MKLTKAAISSIDVSNLSIPDAEEIIEEALSELTFSSDPGLARALHFLAPHGYAVRTGAVSAGTRYQTAGPPKKMKSESILNARMAPSRLLVPFVLRVPLPNPPMKRKTMDRKLFFPPISTHASRNSVRPWLKQNGAVMPSSPSSGSVTPSSPAKPIAGIRIPTHARPFWQRPSSVVSC